MMLKPQHHADSSRALRLRLGLCLDGPDRDILDTNLLCCQAPDVIQWPEAFGLYFFSRLASVPGSPGLPRRFFRRQFCPLRQTVDHAILNAWLPCETFTARARFLTSAIPGEIDRASFARVRLLEALELSSSHP